jgi:mannose-1-phosphate guanylyltransferase/mannose-6-phosphate isomerase
MIIPVILSGGSGSRLWPLSRKNYPKQYLSLTSENTMLQETILRLRELKHIADPIIVCNADHRFLVAEQCHQINIRNPIIMLEPIGQNTAPAIAAAAFQSIKKSDNAVLLVLSADHIIENIDVFNCAIHAAYEQALNGKLTIFGVKPTEANTGYGYIKSSNEISDGVYEVQEFVEKPNMSKAQLFFEKGEYLWNIGIFMFQANTLINELDAYSPKIISSARNAVNLATIDLDFIRLDSNAFKSSPSMSIDNALLEKSNNVVVVQLNTKWSDIGSWSSLYDIGKKDKDGNILIGDVISIDTLDTYINANHHIVATLGVDNLVIVDTPDATLIASRHKAQEVKSVVDFLEANKRTESSSNRKVYRPWGWYDSIELGINFQVKRLNINPGAKLSLQLHNKRAEHWIVVSGVASVTSDEQIFTLKQGESTYIPQKIKHSLENKTSMPLEVIEVQSGSYLGEDDIVRFEDIYGR